MKLTRCFPAMTSRTQSCFKLEQSRTLCALSGGHPTSSGRLPLTEKQRQAAFYSANNGFLGCSDKLSPRAWAGDHH